LDLICKVCHHFREHAPAGGVGGAAKGEAEGDIGDGAEDGNGLDGCLGGVGHAAVGVAVIVFADEEFVLWVAGA
jgi:hypothetical protein